MIRFHTHTLRSSVWILISIRRKYFNYHENVHFKLSIYQFINSLVINYYVANSTNRKKKFLWVWKLEGTVAAFRAAISWEASLKLPNWAFLQMLYQSSVVRTPSLGFVLIQNGKAWRHHLLSVHCFRCWQVSSISYHSSCCVLCICAKAASACVRQAMLQTCHMTGIMQSCSGRYAGTTFSVISDNKCGTLSQIYFRMNWISALNR